ncbi:hypothetical protein SBA2_380021 [Acidobacteriia bacterium SbA2]|nr:hypothetical protein SBA2_380021 [Acidobacteriia bacterium SbA2]
MGGYTYQTLVTNLALQPLNLWRLYSRRARVELIIRELKYASALRSYEREDPLERPASCAKEVWSRISAVAFRTSRNT